MRKLIVWIPPLIIFLFPVLSPALEEFTDPLGEEPLAFERTVEMVILRRAEPARIRENLSLLNRTWGIFPSLQYLELSVPESDGELLFLRGRKDEVARAARIAEGMDRFYPPPPEPRPLAPIPLSHLRGTAMRPKLLSLADASGLELADDQLLVFPPGPAGSLFFRGPAPEARQLRELTAELDQPRHGSWRDLAAAFTGAFRRDLSSSFLTVATYAASALLLLVLHFILSRVPWLGRKYQRWFTLIWTRLIHDVKGRDFAYDVIRDLARTAAVSVEQSSRRPPGAAGSPEPPGQPEIKKSRAMAIARDLLAFRGFDPDDPETERMVSDLVEETVYRLNHPDPAG